MQNTGFRTLGRLPFVPVVFPHGRIRHIPYGQGCHSDIVRIDERTGRPGLTGWACEQGYITLEEAYQMDSREEVRDEGLGVYQAFEQAVREGRAPKARARINPDDPKDERQKIQVSEFPDEWLPEECIARREGRSTTIRGAAVIPKRKTKDKSSRKASSGG